MATKFTSVNQLSLINVPNDSNQYSNLNLNKNIECFDPSFGHSNSKSNNVKNLDFEIAEKSEGKNFWSKSASTDRGSKAFNVFNEAKEKEEVGKKWRSNDSKFLKTTSSTLSLHIAAYENSIDKDDTTKLSSKGQGVKGDHQAGLELCIQDPYEFPRQQEGNDKSELPEIAQFKASQKLLNPNASGTSLSHQFTKSPAIPSIPSDIGYNSNKATGGSRSTGVLSNISSNPAVIVGMGLTTAALLGMIRRSVVGDRIGTQKYMRYRIIAQFFTITALIAGVTVFGATAPTTKDQDKSKNIISKIDN